MFMFQPILAVATQLPLLLPLLLLFAVGVVMRVYPKQVWNASKDVVKTLRIIMIVVEGVIIVIFMRVWNFSKGVVQKICTISIVKIWLDNYKLWVKLVPIDSPFFAFLPLILIVSFIGTLIGIFLDKHKASEE